MRALGLIVLGMLLFSSLALAANYEIRVTPINISTFHEGSATFKVAISNFEDTPQRFQLYSLDTRWTLSIDPLLYTVEPKQLQEYALSVHPTADIGFGAQALTILIKHFDDNFIQKENLLIYVADPNRLPGTYLPSADLDILLPNSINPRQPLSLTLKARNNNGLNMSTAKIILTSPLFTRTIEKAIPPFEAWGEEIRVDLDAYQPSGDYPLTAELVYKGKTINRVSRTISIATITDVVETPEDTEEFLRSATTLKLENKGNTVMTYDAKLPTNIWRRVFSSTVREATVRTVAGETYYVWPVTLAPKEQITITRVENYRFLSLLILLLIGVLLAYLFVRSPIIAAKEAIALKDAGEEGSNALKVRIFVKNRTGSQLTGVTVIDRVPSLATYRAQTVLGAVSPTKVVSNEKGTILKWELDILEPYEERILSYALGSQLKILGKMKLPAAKVKFSTKRGERVTYTKNTVYEE